MADGNEETLYAVGDTARQLGVSIDTIRRWEREGKLHGIRTPGGQRRFPRSEINRLLEVEHVA
jgi:putative resolvase